MKKIVLLSIIALAFSATASAQFYPDGRPIHPSKRSGYYAQNRYSHTNDTYGGLRFGLNIATVNSDSPYLDGNKAKAGINAGIAIGTRLTPYTPLYLESGLYYTQKGGKSNLAGEKFTYNLDYLELPIVLKYKGDIGGGATVEPFVGGFISCGVAGKIKDYRQRAAYSSFSDDYNDNFNRFDGGIRVGCGLSFDKLYLEAAYDFGLTNVGKDDFDDTHTGALNLTVGVNF
ncbi:MAG: PorT family protein [Prevotella sp.]|nr:PorT family protein [Prevotella sp.]